MSALVSADEARALLAGATPGPWEAMEIRDGRLSDVGPEELAVVIRDDARAYQKPDGTWHTVIICRGMDGPTREGNAALIAVAAQADELARLRAERAEADGRAVGVRDAIVAMLDDLDVFALADSDWRAAGAGVRADDRSRPMSAADLAAIEAKFAAALFTSPTLTAEFARLAAALRASWAECERLRAAAAQAVRERDALAGAVRACDAAHDALDAVQADDAMGYADEVAAEERVKVAREAVSAAIADAPSGYVPAPVVRRYVDAVRAYEDAPHGTGAPARRALGGADDEIDAALAAAATTPTAGDGR